MSAQLGTPHSQESIGSRIIFESEQFVVVDKPANLLVHPTAPNGPNTLWNELERLFAFEIANGKKISFVNRLDRETSGIILVARSSEAARVLNRSIVQHRVHKHYTAVVFGWPLHDESIVDQPLLRQGTVRPSKIWLKQAIHPSGYPAFTKFRVLERFLRKGERFAVVEAEPKTGRTHQIRVHLAHLGNPIVGDKIYGPDENCYLDFIENDWTPSLAAKLYLPRQALHASGLSFEFEDQRYSFHSPLPLDIHNFIDSQPVSLTNLSGFVSDTG
jgi:23S rRNA pseudouridine1911/1915/1917 synthase